MLNITKTLTGNYQSLLDEYAKYSAKRGLLRKTGCARSRLIIEPVDQEL